MGTITIPEHRVNGASVVQQKRGRLQRMVGHAASVWSRLFRTEEHFKTVLEDHDAEYLVLVQKIRDEIRLLDYERLDNQALDEMNEAIESAVEDNDSAGVYRTADLKAIHEMLIQERAPRDVRDIAVNYFMSAKVAQASQ